VPISAPKPTLDSKGVKSAYRTLDLLETLAKSDRAVSHSELSARMAIPKSSLTQLLKTLESRAYVESLGPSGPYRLGLSAVNLIRRGLDVQRLLSIAKPHMENLTAVSGYSCGLNILCGDYVERVLGVTAPRAVGYAMHEGVRAPLYASSSGKLFLAHMKSNHVESYLGRVELRPITRRSVRSTSELRRQIELAREEGVAYSKDEFTNGIVGFSVPVLNARSKMAASLGLAIPTEEYDSKREFLILKLRSSARLISAQIFSKWRGV
jgi:DNA-binding IclR family transcriptional regulator